MIVITWIMETFCCFVMGFMGMWMASSIREFNPNTGETVWEYKAKPTPASFPQIFQAFSVFGAKHADL